MDKLLIVDGSNLLFQMFYGMPVRIVNAHGRAIQGTLGFIGALLKIIRMVQPTHVLVAFDGECDNGRTALDENYKANRPDYSEMPEEDTPFSQLPAIYAALDALGLCHAETTDCEADDWLAGYALRYGGAYAVTIASQDSDLCQLISENVRVLRYRGEKTVLCDRAYIWDKLGVTPEQYAAFKSLTGDSSDHIRGADKIGPKTAAALLNQFPDLEGMIAGAGEIRRPSVRESVLRNAARLRLNYLLIKLTGTTELPFDLPEMVWQYKGQTTTEVLRAIGLR